VSFYSATALCIDAGAVDYLSSLENQIPAGDAECERKMLFDHDHRRSDILPEPPEHI
jgi:hypothetical protein